MRISGWSSDWCSSDLWCCRACRAPRAGSALQRRLPRAYRLPMARLLSLLFALMALLLAPPATARERGPVVLAAASLQESLSEAANAWAAEGYPKPVLSFAASSALARQVMSGAPADLFLDRNRVVWGTGLSVRREL